MDRCRGQGRESMDVMDVDGQSGEARPPCALRETARWLCQQLRTTEDWGYFGPTSTIWALHRESCHGGGRGRARRLAVAHPRVGQAVDDLVFRSDQPEHRERRLTRDHPELVG